MNQLKGFVINEVKVGKDERGLMKFSRQKVIEEILRSFKFGN